VELYYYLSIALCGIVLWLKFLLRRRVLFFTPLVMLVAAWMLNAVMMFYVMDHPETKNCRVFIDFAGFGKVLFYFILAGVCGCIFASVLTGFQPFRAPDDTRTDDFVKILTKFVKQFRFILNLNAIFGVCRFFIVFSYMNFDSFGDYRRFAALDLGKVMPMWQALIYRISNHLYVLAGFYIVLYGAYYFFQKKSNWKTFFWNFCLFSIPLMATGGRLWILNFTAYFFSGVLFMYSLFVHTGTANKVLLKLVWLLAGMAFAICMIGQLRSQSAEYDPNQSGTASLWGKMAYVTDGNVMLSNYIDLGLGGITDWGESTFGNAQTLAMIRDYEMTSFAGYVEGTHSHLYFDFGIPGMFIVWFLICAVMEFAALRMIPRMTVFSFLTGAVLIKMMQESIIFNCIRASYPYFEWILLLVFFSKFFQKAPIGKEAMASELPEYGQYRKHK